MYYSDDRLLTSIFTSFYSQERMLSILTYVFQFQPSIGKQDTLPFWEHLENKLIIACKINMFVSCVSGTRSSCMLRGGI